MKLIAHFDGLEKKQQQIISFKKQNLCKEHTQKNSTSVN